MDAILTVAPLPDSARTGPGNHPASSWLLLCAFGLPLIAAMSVGIVWHSPFRSFLSGVATGMVVALFAGSGGLIANLLAGFFLGCIGGGAGVGGAMIFVPSNKWFGDCQTRRGQVALRNGGAATAAASASSSASYSSSSESSSFSSSSGERDKGSGVFFHYGLFRAFLWS